jgi:hypothetical protein
MSGRKEWLLLVLTPAVAVAAVALGLRIGAGEAVRAAVVTGAPRSSAGTGLAWQIDVFDEDRGVREPVALPQVEVVAFTEGATVTWRGATNEDGAAEVLLQLPPGPVHVSVTSAGKVLAVGDATVPAALDPSTPGTGWARFARREGDVVLDVAVLGQRASSGFPASIWVRAADAKGAPLPDVVIEPEHDSGFTPAQTTSTTDARGWAHITATPLGYSVPLLLHAKAPDGKKGDWAGGLFISPGASDIVAKDVYASTETPVLEVAVPTVRTSAYVEIDDAHGRVWASATPLQPSMAATPRATLQLPRLAPGLYWAVAADDPTGASKLGPGTIARPFFVAATPEAALAFGTDAAQCAPPGDVRLMPRVIGVCLALVAPAAVPRWVAVDGFAFQRQKDALARARGLGIAMGAIFLAIVLEAVLLLRAAAISRARLKATEATEEAGDARLVGRGWSVAVWVLVGMLGFALLGAFLMRLA